MKTYPMILLTLFSLLVLSPLNVFACACCADSGYYRISVKKPSPYEIGELKKLSFSNANVYATAGFPDDIKGLTPVSEKYAVTGVSRTGGWSFEFKDDKGKSGTLEFKMPKSFVHYAVDLRDGAKGGANSVMLYKEWRFKSKVKKGSGIFSSGIKGKAEYFLVLQGKGNACTSAENFTHWRLEVTGKNANYAFYGDLNASPTARVETKSKPKSSAPKPNRSKFLAVSNLVGSNYSGCGCSGWKTQKAAKNRKPIFWTEFKQPINKETLFMNFDGKDTELKLLTKDKRAEKEKVGDKYADEYLAKNGTKVILEYTVKKLPCAECEGTDYEVIATVVGEYNGKVLTLSGSCGC